MCFIKVPRPLVGAHFFFNWIFSLVRAAHKSCISLPQGTSNWSTKSIQLKRKIERRNETEVLFARFIRQNKFIRKEKNIKYYTLHQKCLLLFNRKQHFLFVQTRTCFLSFFFFFSLLKILDFFPFFTWAREKRKNWNVEQKKFENQMKKITNKSLLSVTTTDALNLLS